MVAVITDAGSSTGTSVVEGIVAAETVGVLGAVTGVAGVVAGCAVILERKSIQIPHITAAGWVGWVEYPELRGSHIAGLTAGPGSRVDTSGAGVVALEAHISIDVIFIVAINAEAEVDIIKFSVESRGAGKTLVPPRTITIQTPGLALEAEVVLSDFLVVSEAVTHLRHSVEGTVLVWSAAGTGLGSSDAVVALNVAGLAHDGGGYRIDGVVAALTVTGVGSDIEDSDVGVVAGLAVVDGSIVAVEAWVITQLAGWYQSIVIVVGVAVTGCSCRGIGTDLVAVAGETGVVGGPVARVTPPVASHTDISSGIVEVSLAATGAAVEFSILGGVATQAVTIGYSVALQTLGVADGTGQVVGVAEEVVA
jgi:hypothetical protein